MDKDHAAMTAEAESELAAMLIEQLQSMPDPLRDLSAALGISRDCTTRELAEVLGITPRRVESLAAAGWIETSPSSTPRRLRFQLLCAVKQYIDYLRGS